MKMVRKHNLRIVNAEECCNGLWTRVQGEQKSVIDYMIVFEEPSKSYFLEFPFTPVHLLEFSNLSIGNNVLSIRNTLAITFKLE